ncbi:MAG: dual specificity protein phosphatase family protein [Nitrospirales bacterium]|nr:dual specificity protein phosphatase family protein [Nitrospira sp.]MDR4501603.1 dual specificity protein phosphatase family protein [Nitrospirales bacterium]
MDNILGSLYIGNIDDAHTPPPNISALLWTALESKLAPLPQGVILGRIPLREYTEAVPMDIESGIAWLERHLPKHQVLVACRAGMGRSVSVVIAYLCCVQGMSFDKAVEFVRERRKGTTPLPRLEQTIEKVKKRRAKPA